MPGCREGLTSTRRSRRGAEPRLRTPRSLPPPEEMIEGENVVTARHGEEEDQEGQPRNDVRVELVEEVFQQVTVGHDHEDCPQRQERGANEEPPDQEPSGGKFDVGYRNPQPPEQPG